MHRRDLNKALIGGAALAGGLILPGTGRANVEDKEPRLAVTGRVILQIAAARVVLAYLLIASQGRFLGLDLGKDIPQFSENRADASRLPLLGGLLRPTLAARLSGADLAGMVVLYGTFLMLLPTASNYRPPSKTIIAHREMSWEPGGRPRAVTPKGMPGLPALSALPVVGRAYQAKDSLIVLVRPTLVKEPDS